MVFDYLFLAELLINFISMKKNYVPLFELFANSNKRVMSCFGIGLCSLLMTTSPMNATTNASNLEPTTSSMAQQNGKVTGVITDSFGPVTGASVIVKGTTTGVVSDIDGKFVLEGVKTGEILEVSFMGYKTQEIAYTGQATLNITLSEDSELLDEVIVVGYSTQRKESLTGALQTLKSEKLTDISTPNVENMLNGKAPGVYVAPGSGQPGSTGAVVIRGKSTINGSTAPLWVIDGVIVGSSAGALNPTDIETMTILKDAASTAIYGSQGANGVILVTTKTAKAEDIKINFSAKLGTSSLNNGNLEVMDGAQLYDYYKSFSNAEQINFPRWNEDLRNSNYSWWDLATQTGFTQDYNVSLSGGNEKMKSFFSLGVYDETGAVKGYDYTRYNFRFKTDYKPFEFLTIKPSLSGSLKTVDDQQYSVTSMYSNFPWDSPYDENGEIVGHRSPLWVNSNSTNYIYDLQWDKGASQTYEFMGNLDFDIRFTDYLTFSSVNNYRWQGYSYSGYTDPRSNSGIGVKGRLTENTSNMVRRYTNQILRFNKLFGKHSVSALAAYEFNDYWTKSVNATGTGFVPGFEILDVTAKPEKVSGGISEWAVQSLIFNGNYAYDNKYLAQLSIRRDGASNFGDDAKYGNFYSISGGWNIHRENWFKADFIDNLKLRASYGTVGNRPGSLYPQYDLYSVSNSYNASSGALISQIGNKDLTWEKSQTIGIGVDASFFNRLRVSADYYIKDTDNLLHPVPVSGLIGVTSIWKNVGELKNTGIEVSIGGDIITTKDWYWGVDLNLGTNKNEVVSLYHGQAQIIVGDNLGIAGSAEKLLKKGLDSDTYYLREWAGVDPETGAPQWYTNKKNADGSISREKTSKYAEANPTTCGASTPDLFGGFSTNLNYKNFDLAANFGFSLGGKIYNYSRQEYDSDGTYTDRNQMVLMDDWNRWEKPGDIATHPKPSYNNSSNSQKASSRFLEDGDYLKLRSLTLGYNLALPQYHISNVRFFITGENLFVLTDYSGVDPEIPAVNGSALGSAGPAVYPSTRKFMFGLNVSF